MDMWICLVVKGSVYTLQGQRVAQTEEVDETEMKKVKESWRRQTGV